MRTALAATWTLLLGMALLMAVAILAGCATQLPIGRISDRMDRRKEVIAICVLAAICALGAWWPADLSRRAEVALRRHTAGHDFQ